MYVVGYLIFFLKIFYLLNVIGARKRSGEKFASININSTYV